jgi:glucose-1-phosphate thymidylyltransferase
MKAIVLAAGYATRLRRLTDSTAKPLLRLANRPMIEYLCDRVAAVDDVDAIHIVANQKFAQSFEEWARGYPGRLPIVIHNDGSTSAEERLGAIGDMQFAIERGELAGNDVLVVAGDNLIDFCLASCVRFWRSKGEASVIALHDCQDLNLVKQYSVVEVDSQDQVRSFVEKPTNPTSTLVGAALYVYHRKHLELVGQYLAEGQPRDAPGHLVSWLHTRVPVYGYRLDGTWLDIGNEAELLHADNLMRERRGLPRRDSYRP